MTTEQLRDVLNVAIQHPEFVAYGGGRTLVVYTSDDHFEVLDLLLVSSLEFIDGQPRPTTSSAVMRRNVTVVTVGP